MFLQRLTDDQLKQTMLGSSIAAVLVGVMTFALKGGQGGALLTPLLAIPAILAAIELNDRRIRVQWARNVRAAFDSLDFYQDGKRWKASEAELVYEGDALPVPQDDRKLQLALLCRTKRGAWFILDLVTQGPHVIARTLREIDEQEAAEVLIRNEALYRQHFDPAELA